MMMRTRNAIFACLLSSMTSMSLAQNACPALTWSDEFDGNTLDSNNWTPQLGDGCQGGPDLCGWGNFEPQWYRSENLEVSSGTLKITAKEEDFQGKAYTSARLRTFEKVELDLTKDTLVEARIKVPGGGKGLWPAFWMMPSPEVIWPQGGEIDIMEFIGREPLYAQGYMHYGAAYGDKFEKGGPIQLPEPVFEDYHTFAIVKTRNKIAYLLNGYEYQSYNPLDIEPKYSWPFERTYHIILNLAAGGLWPGYPDETTVFPSTMEVDYVRVYDMEGGRTVPLIDGIRLVRQNEQQVEYCVNNANGDSITWTVPGGATFVASSNQDCILVDFSDSSGYVKASVTSECAITGTYDLSIPVQVQRFYGVDFSIFDPATTADFATGSSTTVIMDGRLATEYIRSSELYDNIQIDLPLSEISEYLTGERKFFLDMKTTTSAPCTRVMIQLEDKSKVLPDSYTAGRHSRYQCFLEPTRDWQRIACDFVDRPDLSVTTVDRVVILIDSTLTRTDTYYIGDIDVTTAGCTSDCEALQSNGPSTDNCRKGAKSEAGACSDGVNNDFEGYNGNEITDCADHQCFLIDPECGGLIPSPSPNSITPTPSSAITASPVTTGPSASPSIPPSTSPTISPSDSPTDAPTTSSPTMATTDSSPTSTPFTLQPLDSPTAEPSAATKSLAPTGQLTTETTTSSPTTVPSTTPSPDETLFDGPAECVMNPACAVLANDCCPTVDGIYLFCCFEGDSIQGYQKDFTFVGPQVEDEQAEYLSSTAPYYDPGTAPDGTNPVVSYQRGGNADMYDLIYYQTQAISNAADYTLGVKRFFMDVYSEANECTQIMLQLDALPIASENAYPVGRHSRYVAYTTRSDAWERLEFTYLDQPDSSVSDSMVDSLVLFFDPGSLRNDRYFLRNLDSATSGCDSGLPSNVCEKPSPKSCRAAYNGENGTCDDGIDNDMDGLIDCEDMECMSLDPVCNATVTRSYAAATSQLNVGVELEVGTNSSAASSMYDYCMMVGFVVMAAMTLYA